MGDLHRCFICDEPFRKGDLVLSDVECGLGHRACFGEDRQGYVKDIDTGEPLGADDPIPAGEPYDPADFPECDEAPADERAAARAAGIAEVAAVGAGFRHSWFSQAAFDVTAERRRQVEVELYDYANDDSAVHGELTAAATCYIIAASISDAGRARVCGIGMHTNNEHIRNLWPWPARFWKPKTRRRDLVRAAALIIAEIERMDRAEPAAEGEAT